ncbi:hypothetical protein AKO1_014788 [Acrasis kona]|uniref:Uncharacterized protein n=1 Tax=Acrasis kona TaxID=1008807 RepID=A0AAW2ZCC6_9EUKA
MIHISKSVGVNNPPQTRSAFTCNMDGAVAMKFLRRFDPSCVPSSIFHNLVKTIRIESEQDKNKFFDFSEPLTYNLKHLEFLRVKISGSELNSIIQFLKASNIESLKMSRIFDTRILEILFSKISNLALPYLKSLDFTDNNLTDAQVLKLTLERLNLDFLYLNCNHRISMDAAMNVSKNVGKCYITISKRLFVLGDGSRRK